MNTPQPFDPEKFKAAAREQWNISAKGWNNQTAHVRKWLRQSTKAMLDMAEVKPGSRVLDVAAGAGDQTLDIAERVGSGGHVLATDLSPGVLEFAKENLQRAGYAFVETKVADGENLDVPEASFDAAVCRLSMMLFPDPLKALRGMFRALKPGGRACVTVFSAPDKNPCVAILASTAFKHAGLPPQNPFQPGAVLSLGKPGLIDERFVAAGFSDVRTEKLSAPFSLPSVDHYIEFIRTSAGPIVQILGNLNDAAKEAAWAEMKQKLEAFNTPSGWEGPNELLLTVGRRA
jgi:SAM-dependent methyltransferase